MSDPNQPPTNASNFSEVAFFREQVADLKGTVANLSTTSTKHATEISEIQGDRRAHGHEIRDLKTKLDEYSERIRRLEKELHDTETKLSAEITKSAKELRDDIEELARQIRDDIERRGSQWRESVGQLENHFDRKVSNLEKTVAQAKGGLQVVVICATLLHVAIAGIVGIGGLVSTLFLHFAK